MSSPLNKISVLDSGHVALLGTSLDGSMLSSIEDEYFRTLINRELWRLASMTLLVKCPLFVQLHLSNKQMRIIQLPDTSENIDIYIPDLSEIHTGSTEDDRRIAEYIRETTEALRITPEGLQQDGCDRFVSQVLTPISAYNEVIVHGSLSDWLSYIKQRKLPSQLEAYRGVIESVMSAEWKELDKYKKG